MRRRCRSLLCIFCVYCVQPGLDWAGCGCPSFPFLYFISVFWRRMYCCEAEHETDKVTTPEQSAAREDIFHKYTIYISYIQPTAFTIITLPVSKLRRKSKGSPRQGLTHYLLGLYMKPYRRSYLGFVETYQIFNKILNSP